MKRQKEYLIGLCALGALVVIASGSVLLSPASLVRAMTFTTDSSFSQQTPSGTWASPYNAEYYLYNASPGIILSQTETNRYAVDPYTGPSSTNPSYPANTCSNIADAYGISASTNYWCMDYQYSSGTVGPTSCVLNMCSGGGTTNLTHWITISTQAPTADATKRCLSYVGFPYTANTYFNCSVQTHTGAAQAAPTVTLNANPTSIVSGNSSSLSLSSTNATACTSSDFATGNATSGTFSVSPTSTKTYTVTCTGPGGTSAPATATVTVTPAPHNPNTPSIICPSGNVTVGVNAPVTVSGTDSSENVAYWMDWDNTLPGDERLPASGWVPSGTSETFYHSWSSPGTYSYRAFSGNQTSGYYSGFASCTTTVIAAPVLIPDLTAGTISPTTAVAGTAKTFTATIYNNGTATASNGGTVTNLLEYATNASGANEVDSGNANTGAIAAGSSAVASFTYSFPSAGTYYLRACADNDWHGGSGFIGESDESNNCGTWTAVSVSAPPVAPSVSITASPTSIITGGSSTLTWSSTNATSCTGTSFSTGGATSGSVSVSPTVTTTYTATCTGPGGSGSNTATVTVTGSPAQPDLTAGSISPGTATTGTAQTFSVTITNAGTAAALGADGKVWVLFQYANDSSGTGFTDMLPYHSGDLSGAVAANNGTRTASITHTFPSVGTFYVRACADKDNALGSGEIAETNEGNNCGTWTPVVVSTAVGVPNVTFTANPTSITSGGSSTLTLTTSNATSCTGTNFSPGGATSGNFTVNPTTTTTYSVTCTGPGGTSSPTSATVTVTAGGLGSCVASDTGNVIVTGATSGGTVWGSSPYTQDSNIGMAAVHKGLITVGQQAIIHKQALGDLPSFTGTTAHGVTTTAYGTWCGIDITLVQILGACSGVPTPTISASPTKVQSGSQTTITWSGSNVSTSCVLQKNGTPLATQTPSSCTVNPQTTMDTVTSQSKYCVVCDGGTPQCTTVTPIAKFTEF